MKIVFLWVLSWSAHPSLVRKCCSLRTLLSISNNTITLYRREFSLNIRGMTVIGTYSSKLDTVLYILCWHSTYPAMKQVLSYITYNNMEWVILLHWISSFKGRKRCFTQYGEGQSDSTQPPWPICCFWHNWHRGMEFLVQRLTGFHRTWATSVNR